jgi:DDE superfamily endonuclease
VDETADEKSSGNAAGAARQYSGTVGGIALCQVAVTLTYATRRGHALIGRALYLPEGCAADEEHRELAGVPEEVMSPPSRKWPAPCSTARTAWGSAPPSWPRRSPACQAEQRPGRRAGHPLEVLAPLDRDLPARLYLPRGRGSPATRARRQLRPGRRADPDQRSGTAAAPA